MCLAHGVAKKVKELNLAVLQYWLGHDPAERARFRQAADDLSHRAEQLNADALLPESKEILLQLSAEFSAYRKRVEELFEEGSSSTASTPDGLAQLGAASERVLALEARLSTIQREALASFVSRLRAEMDGLWDALYGAMAIMLLFGLALAWVAYRDLIAPLRRTVVESHRLLGQQEKLAALGLLTAGLAHEIRNPLNSIKARLFAQRREGARLAQAEAFQLVITDLRMPGADGLQVIRQLHLAKPRLPIILIRRNTLPGRDRGHEPGHADQTAAGPSGKRDSEDRR